MAAIENQREEVGVEQSASSVMGLLVQVPGKRAGASGSCL
jgi:hypothetical protein